MHSIISSSSFEVLTNHECDSHSVMSIREIDSTADGGRGGYYGTSYDAAVIVTTIPTLSGCRVAFPAHHKIVSGPQKIVSDT